jgi:hypothetical protein
MEETPHTGSLHRAEEATPTVSAVGVPGGKWYVAIVKRNSEKTSRDKLKDEGYEAYVATQTMLRRYAKRKPQPVEYVRIPAKVFVRMKTFPEGGALSAFFEGHPYISSFMPDRARKRNAYERPAYAEIRDSEIQQVREILEDTEREVLFGAPDDSYTIGETVRAVHGPLRGHEGTLAYKSGKSYFCLEIEGLDWARVQISAADIAKLENG